MSQAECTTTTRRAILKSAPTFIAAAALPVAAIAAVLEADDPIFALIEDHRAAWSSFIVALKKEDALEDELPSEQRRTSYWWDGVAWNARGEFPEDDPRWLQFWRDYIANSERSAAAADALAFTEPTTIAGVIALASYAVGYVRSGEVWPDGEWDFEDGGKDACTITFETVLLAGLASSLKRITGAAS